MKDGISRHNNICFDHGIMPQILVEELKSLVM